MRVAEADAKVTDRLGIAVAHRPIAARRPIANPDEKTQSRLSRVHLTYNVNSSNAYESINEGLGSHEINSVNHVACPQRYSTLLQEKFSQCWLP